VNAVVFVGSFDAVGTRQMPQWVFPDDAKKDRVQNHHTFFLYHFISHPSMPRPRKVDTRARKNMDMDAEKLSKAQAILGARSETEAVDMALDYVLLQGDVTEALDRLAALGGLDDVFSYTSPRSRRRVAER
jgi:hypothetical protein